MEINIQDVLKNIGSLANGADPLARQFVLNNRPDHEMLRKKIREGTTEDKTSFGYQFANACSDYTVQFITERGNADEKLEEGIRRFSTAVLQLNDLEFAFALEHLKAKLAIHAPDFTQKYKEETELSSPIRQRIAQTIVNNDEPQCNLSKRDIIIKAVTDYDRMQNSSRKPK